MNTIEQIKTLEKEIEEKKKELLALRKQVPPTPVQDYELVQRDGSSVRLSQLFGDYDEMLLIHNMGSGCAYCTLWGDGFNSLWAYLKSKCAFVLTSPDLAPEMARFVESRSWDYPCVSIHSTTLTKDFGFDADFGTWPGVTAIKKHQDGSMTRHSQARFGPGDDYCAFWGLVDLLDAGVNGWEATYNK
jgi:predicted dithiol-disulfide oxidoreductase (DUF899 family)